MTKRGKDLVELLLTDPAIAGDPVARELAVVLTVPVGTTSKGHPYLQEPAWTRFRDWVPHILGDGPRVLEASRVVADAVRALSPGIEAADPLALAPLTVVRQVVLTAAVTAPPDLWLLRHVLAAFSNLGLSARLLDGEILHAGALQSDKVSPLLADELRIDLRFLLSRGLLRCAGEEGAGFRLGDHEAARAAFQMTGPLPPLPDTGQTPLSVVWANACRGDPRAHAALRAAHASPLPAHVSAPGRFAPSPSAIERGFRLVPLVLGLRIAARVPGLLAQGRVDGAALTGDEELGAVLDQTLHLAGVTDESGELGDVGRRVLEKGPGPFGIIEAYDAYVRRLDEILTQGRRAVWVSRGANVAASQDANRQTFERANDALDRFCEDTGFTYGVFIEHALGRGEATRQRLARSGPRLRYVGADLEDAAIDAAIAERDAGRLPDTMTFIRGADIGKPQVLLDALTSEGVEVKGAVMMVGNGFHEVRGQTDDKMTGVFAAYAQAGVVLVFTEETGLSVEDVLATAWNTYHAGFKYVHERSGQGLRPADRRVPSALEGNEEGEARASWAECAARAGYTRLNRYSPRGRTAYPYTPASGHNPAISVTHFCVPRALLQALPRSAI